MIGRSCKRREALRRAVLIGRALPREGARAPAARGPPAWAPSSLPDRHAAPRVGPRGREPSGQSRARRGRGRGGRDHPNPFRTRQLSLPSPKVLRWSPWEDRTSCSRRALPASRPRSTGALRGPFLMSEASPPSEVFPRFPEFPVDSAPRGWHNTFLRRLRGRTRRAERPGTLRSGYCETPGRGPGGASQTPRDRPRRV